MNDIVLLHELKTSQNLHRESSDERQREPVEVIGLEQIIQVHAEQFKSDAGMFSKGEVLMHLDCVELVNSVIALQM